MRTPPYPQAARFPRERMAIDLQRNLLTTLNPAGLPAEEITEFIRCHFGSASIAGSDRVVRCPMRPPYCLRMEYNEKGRLTGIFAEREEGTCNPDQENA